MQDFSKEEFGLLGASVVGTDKDLIHTGGVGGIQSQHLVQSHIHNGGANGIHHSGLHHVVGNIGSSSVVVVDDIKLGQASDLIEASDASKLDSEVDRDLYPWSTSHHIGSQFLRSSDDPLISGGTNDNQNDNELSVASHQSMCSSPTPPPVPQKSHHHRNTIVVPASILSPELPPDTPVSPLPTPPRATGGGGRRGTSGGSRQRRKGPIKLRFHHQALPPEYLDHYEATQNLSAKREQLQLQQQQNQQNRKMERQVGQEREDRTNESVRNWLQKILELQKEGVSLAPIKDDIEVNGEAVVPNAPKIQRNKVVSYTDLPYMGEMTLENSKPRRGRKPKKADICHLIYKNYGTILPGTPKPEAIQERVHNGNRAQTRSSSLLERRLTEKGLLPENGKGKREEPLNLCVRDGGTDSLALSSSDDESDFVIDSACHTPIIAPSDISTDLALAETMKMSLPNLQSTATGTSSSGETPSTAETPPGYMYWPNVGGFIHPMALYYQKLVDTNNGQSSPSTNSVPSTPNDTTKPSTASSTNSTPPPTTPSSPAATPKPQTLVPKPISQLIKPEKTPKSSQDHLTKHSPPTQKRKRSAIFIPPVPAENSTNPATEVSICKFKFTGGAKPCLQEKKMLSVDSGGNFRYYSGTGDKSMRGYEFFPRESLQQSSLYATTTTGAFLNTPPVEKIACDLPPPSLGLSNDILQIPDFPSAAGLPGLVSPGTGTSFPSHPNNHHRSFRSAESSEARRARRRSRRTTQRESLEKTFKEKGFLIQTQQLQSAEAGKTIFPGSYNRENPAAAEAPADQHPAVESILMMGCH